MVCSVFELLVLVVLVRSGLPVLSVLVLVLVLVLMLAVLFVLAVLVLTVLVLLNCLLLAEVVCAPNGSVPAPASSSKPNMVSCDVRPSRRPCSTRRPGEEGRGKTRTSV